MRMRGIRIPGTVVKFMAVAVVVFALLHPGAAFSQSAGDRRVNHDPQEESRRGHRDRPGQQAGQAIEILTVCANEAPRGWIRTNDQWNPTICGKPTTIDYNVWTIEKYWGRPMGTILRACSGPVPRGWVMIDAVWNPTMCGHPTAMTKNVMTIKRID